MDLGLSGAPVLITGAASGIGRACAIAFADSGASVGLIDRCESGLAATATAVREAGADAFLVVADVTDEEQVSQAVARLADELGGIRIIVACAGTSGPFGKRPEELALAEWNEVFAVNVSGPFLLAKHALVHLERERNAAIVFLASDSGFVAAPGMLPYNASKGALVQLTRALSVELADREIRVNSVCPSIVDTPMSRRDLGLPQGFKDANYPVQTAQEVANHILYLASPASRPINGVSLLSDFGYTARSSFPA